jgi:hypothetical protein
MDIMKRSLLRWLTRTPVQTFVLCPLLVVAFELVRQGERLTVVPAGLGCSPGDICNI